MRRYAKLYILMNKDWKPLADIFINHRDATLQNDISIFKIGYKPSLTHYYAIITLSDSADNIVEEYGAEVAETDLVRNTLQDHHEALFGEVTNVNFLERIP